MTSGHSGRQDALLGFYTDLLRQWINQTSPQGTRAGGPTTPDPKQEALHDLVSHVSHLSTSLILTLPLGHETQTTSSILTFYTHLATSAYPSAHRIPIFLPPPLLTSLLILTPSTTALSRAAGLVAAYKIAFNLHPTPVRDYYATSLIDTFNVCIRDVYNLVWISRALVSAKDDAGRDKALGLHCDPTLRTQLTDHLAATATASPSSSPPLSVDSAFGISNNALLASLARAAWTRLEDREIERLRENGDEGAATRPRHEGPVSQRSLAALKKAGGVDVGYEAYRVEVLRYMEARGLGGIKDFMWASSESVKNKYE